MFRLGVSLSVLFTVFVLSGVSGVPEASAGTTINVTPGAGDAGAATGCSLREAISSANTDTSIGGCAAGNGADVIQLPSGVYSQLGTASENGNATGDLDITSSLTISGAGANLTVIDGGGIDRVLDIYGTVTVTITGVTVTGGNDATTDGGGGIKQAGTVTLANVAVSGNVAVYGAGIEKNGTLTVINSTISNNVASYGPGGIDNYNGGDLTVTNSTISANSGGLGGAIGNSNYGPTMYLNNSTLSGNSAPYSTLYVPAGTVFMKNTIIDGSGGGNCNFPGAYTAALVSLGHNLSTDVWCDPAHVVSTHVTGGLNAANDMNSTPANLAPLSNYGGPTKTHALLATSDAIDKIDPIDCTSNSGAPILTDQRGAFRPQGARCDIGAYEVGPLPVGPCIAAPANMLSWWPEDVGANDFLDSNDPLLIGGTNGVIFAAGMVANGAKFNGSNSFIEIPESANLTQLLSQSQLTMDAWVRPDGPGGLPNDAGGYVIISKVYTSNTSVELTWNTAGKFRFYTGNGGYIQSARNFPAGNFYHVAGTVQGGTFKLYVDGALEATGAGYVGSSTIPWAIGSEASPFRPNFARTWNGVIDEVQLYKRALTQTEIQSIVNAGSAGVCKVAANLTNSGPAKVYCLNGTSTGASWTWQTTGSPASSKSGMVSGVLPLGSPEKDIVSAWVASINTAFGTPAPGPPDPRAKPLLFPKEKCFSVSGITGLIVNGCTITVTTGCTFNPTVIEVEDSVGGATELITSRSEGMDRSFIFWLAAGIGAVALVLGGWYVRRRWART